MILYSTWARPIRLLNQLISNGNLQNIKTVKKSRRKGGSQVLDKATNNLLLALKKDMLAKDGRVDYDKLRKEGYSERLLAQLDDAS